MPDTKISALADIVTLAAGDKLAVADASDLTASKSATMTEVIAFLRANNGLPDVRVLTTDYTNSTTTGTEVTGLSFNTVVAGTYWVRWALLYLPAATTTSIKFGVNPTGTLTSLSAMAQFPSAGVTAATGTMHDAANATTGQVWAYANTRTASTTAPNLGPWVATTNAQNHLLIVEALIVTTGTGDMELWCGAEVAAQISLVAGSSGMLIRTN